LAATLCVIVVLCSGVTQLSLTVDPIKLWAAPTSRARIEREYFEKTFRPFYR
jgi:Niemann-Pick C1 protein